MDTTAGRNQLVAVVRALAAKQRAELERLKQEASGLARPDFIWHYLLQSFSTMGRASGWHGLIGNQDNYLRVTYPVLAALSPETRKQQVQQVCRVANSLAVWETATFDSLILRVGDTAMRLGELGFESIELKPTGKIIFPVTNGVAAEFCGPCVIDQNTTAIPGADSRIILERQQIELHRIRGAAHSVAHEVWSISKNVYRAINSICYILSKP